MLLLQRYWDWNITILILNFDFGLVESYIAFDVVRGGIGRRIVPKCDLRHLSNSYRKLQTMQRLRLRSNREEKRCSKTRVWGKMGE
jgi:hypothetical protein